MLAQKSSVEYDQSERRHILAIQLQRSCVHVNLYPIPHMIYVLKITRLLKYDNASLPRFICIALMRYIFQLNSHLSLSKVLVKMALLPEAKLSWVALGTPLAHQPSDA